MKASVNSNLVLIMSDFNLLRYFRLLDKPLDILKLSHHRRDGFIVLAWPAGLSQSCLEVAILCQLLLIIHRERLLFKLCGL